MKNEERIAFVPLHHSRYATRVITRDAPSRTARGLAWVALSAVSVFTLAVTPTLAAEPEKAPEKAEEEKVARDPDEGIARPEAEDLRAGHVLISLSGGAWVPSNPLFPAVAELGDPDVGGTAHLHLGFGLNRFMVLQASGGFAMAPSAVDSGSATSIDADAAFLFHLTQGFALDPWVGYGVGYRHNILSLDTVDTAATSALDFAKLSLGATYSPTPAFGFGPYAQTDIGVRDFDNATFYVAFHIGMKVTFDPVRAGASASPLGSAAPNTLFW